MWGFHGGDSEGRRVGCGNKWADRNVHVFYTILVSSSSVHYGWTAQCYVPEDSSFDFLRSLYKNYYSKYRKLYIYKVCECNILMEQLGM
jgi:hypothetical protein